MRPCTVNLEFHYSPHRGANGSPMAGICMRVFSHCRYTRALAGALGWARAAAVGTSPRRHLENVDPDQGSTAKKTRWEYDSTKNTAPSRFPIAHKGNASGYL